jgi:hypothetical protein
VLLVEDATPDPAAFVHAIAVGLEPADGALPEGALSEAIIAACVWWRGATLTCAPAGCRPTRPRPWHAPLRLPVFAWRPAPDFGDTPGRDEVLEVLRERAIASGA